MMSKRGKAPQPVLMDAGFLTPWIAEFACSLKALAHSDLTISDYMDSARHFGAWVCDAGLQLDGIDKGAVDGFARHHCRCAGYRRWDRVSAKYARRAGRFVAFLVERGVAPAAVAAPAEIVHPQVLDYQRWLSVHRGLSDRSVSRQGRMVKRLLVALGEDPRAYSATTIRAAVRAEAQGCEFHGMMGTDFRRSRWDLSGGRSERNVYREGPCHARKSLIPLANEPSRS